jgi:hypothetical protein
MHRDPRMAIFVIVVGEELIAEKRWRLGWTQIFRETPGST